jgi:hypothetical protein
MAFCRLEKGKTVLDPFVRRQGRIHEGWKEELALSQFLDDLLFLGHLCPLRPE